jgi:polyhydroxybutyrate depolymerase
MPGNLLGKRPRLAAVSLQHQGNVTMPAIARSLAILLLALCPSLAAACGETTDCDVESGTYRIRLPEGATGPIGALVFAHGYQGSSAGTMRGAGLRRMTEERGLALIAIDALGGDWDLPNAPGHATVPRDEMVYLDQVVADAVAKFNIDRDRIVITGFSAGGMFTWNAICDRGDAFAGYLPYSGTFWQGPPEGCAGEMQNMIHLHGTADRTVPLAGRPIAETRQGDVAESFAMYMADKGFSPDAGYALGDMTCSHNVAGDKRLDLCLFDGDHDFRVARLGAAYDLLMQ